MDILQRFFIFCPLICFGYISLVPNVMLSDGYHFGYYKGPFGYSSADRGILASKLFIFSGISGLINNKYLPLKVSGIFFCLAIIIQFSAFMQIGKFYKK